MQAILITLQRLVERRVNAYYLAEKLRAAGIEPFEMGATDYQHMDFRNIEWAPQKAMLVPLTAGELACAWSHIQACKWIVLQDEPMFVIEDDCHLLYPLNEVKLEGVEHFLSLSHWAPEDPGNKFEMLEDYPQSQLVRGLPYGTQVYYMTVEGAKAFLTHALPVRWAADVALNQLSCQGHLKTLLSKRPAGIQHPVIESHIGRR